MLVEHIIADGAADRGERVVPSSAGGGRIDARSPSISRKLFSNISREPLTHFVLLGVLLFAVVHIFEARSRRYLIQVDPAEVQRLVSNYSQQYGGPPDATKLSSIIKRQVRQDILYREAQARGLDQDDEIVKRRIAQKYEFLMQDNVVLREPSIAQQQDWFDRHRKDYSEPARRTISHVYFAVDRRGEAAARALAETAAINANRGVEPSSADDFPGTKVVRLLSQADIGRFFGDDLFAASVFAAPVHRWVGPFRSGFGWHLIRITEMQPSQLRTFAAAHDDVRRDWMNADREAQNEQAYAKLLKRYHVVVEEARR